MNKKVVRILGAGISGLSAAVVLGKAGYSVEVFEKEKQIGHEYTRNVCALRNYAGVDPLYEFRKFGLDLRAGSITERVVKKSPSFSRVVGNRRYYIVNTGGSRMALEQQLYAEAISSGVEVFFNCNESSDVDILATGTPQMKKKIYGTGFCCVDLNADKNSLFLLYNNNFAPRGYMYILSYEDYSMVMAVSFDQDSFSTLDKKFNSAIKENTFLRKVTKDAKIIDRIRGYGYYSKNPIDNAVKDHKLVVGEAAGFQDASRGFGIRYGVLTGCLAAKSIIENKDYIKLLKNYFKHEFDKNMRRRKIHDNMANEDFDRLVGF